MLSIVALIASICLASATVQAEQPFKNAFDWCHQSSVGDLFGCSFTRGDCLKWEKDNGITESNCVKADLSTHPPVDKPK